ncbi:EAL domain-containing protein [Rhizobium sp. SL42]|uniref:EAL domain-containing protein n=1 Tax=Rhizobium sp. SL42 TaxID=2806346 RepID=UPI001F2A750F|nr:EAL domain-containing protein [Rhizobium sp. SL42]UJW76473.1 EAL domain-containing protein [Rhizobium sp. SL42]
MDSGLNHVVLVNNARRALEKGRFELIYQPIYSVGHREVDSLETLLRWRMEPGKLAAAQEFRGIFRDPSMSLSIRNFVLENTIRQAAAWQDDGHHFGRLSINTTAFDLCSGDLAGRLETMLELYRLSPDMIEIEVPENALYGPRAIEVGLAIEMLCYSGFSLALDNFGATYAGLSALRRYPFSRLKIDRSLIRNALTNSVDRAIIRHVIGLGHDLGITITASGVESEAQMEAALHLGVDSIQGYFVCFPKEAEMVPRVCHVLNLQGRSG